MKNVKSLVLALTSLTFAAAAGAAVPTTAIVPGKYEGHGHWRDSAGGAGDYSVITEAAPDRLVSNYVYGSDQKVSIDMAFSQASEGFYDVRMGGVKTGEAYCLAIQCHWTLNGTDGAVEETLTFWEGKLYKIGSKKSGTKTVSWVESLNKK